MRLPDYLHTTAFRLSLAMAGFFTASAVAVFAFVYWQTVDYESDEIDNEVMQVGRAIANTHKPYVERRLIRWLGEQDHVARYGLIIDENGAKLAGNLDRMPEGALYDGMARTLTLGGVADEALGGAETVRGAALITRDGLSLLVAEDTDEWEHFRDVVIRALGLGLVPLVGLGCLGGALFGRATLARMATLERSFDLIVHGDLSERLPLSSKRDEFDRLASRVNLVLDDLQRLLMEAQAVGDGIAHDLRTPLTRMRARLENAKAKAATAQELRAAIDEAFFWLDQTMGVIAALLRIGEIEHGRRRAAFREFEAGALLREVYDLMAPLAEEKGVAFRLELPADEAPLTGDRELLLEALVNLVDNAIKFTASGGACVLSLSENAQGLSLAVRDSGPGIPAAERAAVMQRFFKGSAHRYSEGAGLGLALVAAVARLHDLDLVVGDNAPGCVMELRTRRGAAAAEAGSTRVESLSTQAAARPSAEGERAVLDP